MFKAKNPFNVEFNTGYEDQLSPSTFKGGKLPDIGALTSGGDNVIKIFGISLLVISLIGAFYRPDFPNELGGLIVYLGTIFASQSEPTQSKKILKNLFYSVLVLIVYDIIWLIIHITNINIDKYHGGHENLISILSLIVCGLTLVIKAFLSVCLYKQANKVNQASIDYPGLN